MQNSKVNTNVFYIETEGKYSLCMCEWVCVRVCVCVHMHTQIDRKIDGQIDR